MWPDWTHCNALVYMPDGNLLLSSRHQSWVLKIQYLDGLGNGDVLWRFGPDGDFTLTPNDPTQWFWDQHYPVLLKVDGSKITLGLYDNGNQRPHDGQQCYLTNSCYSRGVIFDLDESTLTADIAWQYKLPFRIWGGSIVTLPNGNIEIDSSSFNGGNSRVVEVTHESNPRQVWRMDSDDNCVLPCLQDSKSLPRRSVVMDFCFRVPHESRWEPRIDPWPGWAASNYIPRSLTVALGSKPAPTM